MIITVLEADGFKNLDSVKIFPDKRLNIFFGENAQGKTNLIEAVWLCSGCKSFRGTRDKDFVSFSGDFSKLSLEFSDIKRSQEISVLFQRAVPRDKSVFLNGVRQNQLSLLFGSFKCVVFTPSDLELSKGSPENRRSFLDLCISQIKPAYRRVIEKYEALVFQRNSLLKNISAGISREGELEVWDEQLSRIGSYISVLRYNFTKKLCGYSKRLYNSISSGSEKLELEYSSTVFDSLEGRTDFNGEMAAHYLSVLKSSVREDIRAGFTQTGTHRDELIIKINGLSVREFGSQGQQRSAALILKLSQAYILSDETGDSPVILLDDVLSELDSKRQAFVLSHIEKMQVFITCCNIDDSFFKGAGKLFEVKKGKVTEISGR